jgi:hypothetical protein
VPVREEWREAAARVKETRDRALGAADIALEVLRQAIQALPALAVDCDALVEKLAERGVTDPTPDDVLSAAEELADRFDPELALRAAPPAIRAAIEFALALASMGATRDKLERLTYRGVRDYALEKRNLELLRYLDAYPRLSEKVILWARSRLEKRSRR